jgi:tetratricopeptide (TPR) repeat protein
LRTLRADKDSAANVEHAREVGDLQNLYPALGQRAFTLLAQGKHEEADEIAREYLADRASRESPPIFGTWGTGPLHLVWALLDLGYGDELQQVLSLSARPRRPWWDIALLIVSGELEGAAERLTEIGDRPDGAYARLRAARKLVGQGRFDEARAQLDRALAFYPSAGAAHYVADAETLLAASP